MDKQITARFEGSGLAGDAIQVSAVRVTEHLGAPHEVEIDFVTFEAVDGRSLVGAPAALGIFEDGVAVRRWSGFVDVVTDRLQSETDYLGYTMKLSPRARMLDFVRAQEIYINTSVPDIVRAKLALTQMTEGEDFELRLTGTYTAREFVVQYGESDLSFLRRLCEHLGVTLFFEQRDDTDVLVLTDHAAGFTRVEAPLTFRFRGEQEDVFDIELRSEVIPAMYAVADYNYETPQVDLTGICNIEGGFVGGVVEYHAHVLSPDESSTLARIRAEQALSHQHVFTARSRCPQIAAGHVFKLSGHPRFGDIDLLVIEARHNARFENIGGDAAKPGYECTFKAVPTDVPFRPHCTTRRPRIHGLVSGIIEAEPKLQTERAFIDEKGRYLVRMLFDTTAPEERRASLPIRMMQAHAGPNYGIHYPLRPGTEVMVAFVGGDPDRPVIVGAVPNTVTPTPVTRESANLHRIKTWSGVMVEIDDDG